MKLLSIMVPSRDDFNNTVTRIVQGPEYKHLKSGFTDFIDRIKSAVGDWIAKQLKKVFSDAASVGAISNKLSTVFIIIGLLVIIAIIIIIALKINKTMERKRRVKEILGEKIDEKTTPMSLRRKALRFREEGELRQAVRMDFIALLLLMHEKSLLYLDETKTNEEIYNYLKKNSFSNLHGIRYLMDNFNSTWYGNKSCSKELNDNWEDNLNLVWNEVVKYEA